MEVKERVRSFLQRSVPNMPLQDDTDIFAAGWVNSLFAMQLVLFVENEFGVSVGDEDLDIDNFRSVSAISSLIERKQAALA
ncbi:MAG: hypothetical protein OHK0022_11380 [Roseiflexaceae bacterium]